jgi:spermidine synthase
VYSENSVCGNVAVVRQGTQHTFYADGIPILTSPVPDVATVEELVHFPLLFVEQPTRALVLSGGVGGVLRELEKYPFQEIDYAELDPLLLEAVELFPDSLTREELEDPRVRVEHVDGRLMVRSRLWESANGEQEAYDVAIINLPYPSTLQLNRFYTEEFFRMVRELLGDDGVLVVTSPGSLTYLSDELRGLNATAYDTLRKVFPYVRPVAGDLTLWLASPAEGVEGLSVEVLVDRWQEWDLEAQLVTADYIRFRLDQRYLEWFWDALERGGAPVADAARTPESEPVNRDLHPIGLFHGLSYWNAVFSPGLARVFAGASGLRLWPLGLLIIGGSLLFVIIGRAASKGSRAVVQVVIITTGFSGMTADLVIVFGFQTLYGHVYHWIGLLITAFMAGLSLGGLLVTRGLARIGKERSALLRLEVGLIAFWVLLPIILSGLYARNPQPLASAQVQGLLLLLNSVAGFLVGAQFPLANRMWLREGEPQRGTVGVLYASDLVGAFLASIAVSVFLIPILGIVETCLLTAMLKAGSLVMATILLRRS